MKLIYLLILSVFTGNMGISQATNTESDWCHHPIRQSFSKLDEIKTTSKWFKVYHAGDQVIAIFEPYNFEEVISYLILGRDTALLFDTGMGLDAISPLIKQLTKLPVIVINSHTHFDHIGGNYEFRNILAMKTDFTIKHAQYGYRHNDIKEEVTKASLCLQQLPSIDTAHYYTKPFKITRFVKDGDEIDLGKRRLQIIAIAGHAPDAIGLFDKANGYLWTGDSFYEGPIYLFGEGTSLVAYEKSVARLAQICSGLKKVFPSHNNPVCKPERLLELKNDFAKVKKNQSKATDAGNNTLLFKFQYFGLLVDKNELKKFRNQ